jgi:hypothetical protein
VIELIKQTEKRIKELDSIINEYKTNILLINTIEILEKEKLILNNHLKLFKSEFIELEKLKEKNYKNKNNYIS